MQALTAFTICIIIYPCCFYNIRILQICCRFNNFTDIVARHSLPELQQEYPMENIAKKENQRITLTRRLLLEALLQLLEKKHINEISVTELCKCAGINRATFYKHYATPNDVFSEYIEKHIQYLLELQNPKHSKSQLQILEDCCEYIHAHAELFRLFAKNHMDEDFSRKVFLRMLQQSSSAGAMHQAGFDENDIKLTTSYVASGYYYMIRRWLVEKIPKTPKEIASLLLRLSPTGLISE